MAETHHALMLPETDATTLKEALQAQQQILQKLYRELDVEREAAATAASEAMSMILRLQGEKAELKMEANQYKRMAEEKMCHAEETLEICDDLMYQKEMEIASLEFQLQSYRNRLVSMGFSVPEPDDQQLPHTSNVRRLNSLPQLGMLDFGHKKIGSEKKQSGGGVGLADLATTSSTIDEESEFQEIHELEKKLVAPTHGDINSCWEQIKKLDERLKGMSDGSNNHGHHHHHHHDHKSNNPAIWRGGTWSHSLYSQLAEGNGTSTNDLEAQSPRKKGSRKLGRKDSITEEESIHCSQNEKKAPKDAPVVDNHGLPPPPPPPHPHHHHPLVSPAEYQKLMRRIERLERTKNNVRHHENISSAAEEEMHLLKTIQEQLDGIQTELQSRKARKHDEPCLDVLQEAMLYFWI